ncbi:MAG: DUF4115 domain-containing protein [Chloroflexota bacterium]|nr:DUF4115 domain-containing protein [Chloroflexota bacterium]
MATSTRPTRPGHDSPERWGDRPVRDSHHRRPRPDGERASSPQTPGERLRAARTRRRISLTEAEQATHIRARYLQALEDDEYAALPSGVYSRGFLRNYAIYLGVPPDEVMATMPERRRRDRRPGVRSVAPPIKVSAPRSIWLIAAATAGVLVLGALIWLGLSAPEPGAPGSETGRGGAIPQGQSQGATPSSGAIVSLPPLATAGATQVPTAAPTPAPSPTTPVQGVQVDLRVVERAWVRATVDGRVVLEETLATGQNQRWTGQQSVLLRVGNGAAVDVSVNGQRVGILGPAGQPIDREFRR